MLCGLSASPPVVEVVVVAEDRTEALCESRMLTSPGAPLMMKPPLRLGKLCGSPDQSVASEDGGTGPCGWLSAYQLRSPACQALRD